MKFSPKTEDELRSMMIVHGGTYDFEVADAENAVSKKGNDMIALKLTVFTSDGTEQQVRDWLVGSDHPLQLAKLQAFCKATGLLEHYFSGTLDADLCKGLGGKLKIAITDSPQYGQQRSVADYLGECPASLATPIAAGPTASQTARANNAIPDDEIPF
jgi:VCBS repeat-containing protein